MGQVEMMVCQINVSSYATDVHYRKNWDKWIVVKIVSHLHIQDGNCLEMFMYFFCIKYSLKAQLLIHLLMESGRFIMDWSD